MGSQVTFDMATIKKLAGLALAGSGLVGTAMCNADHIPPPDYPFTHTGFLGGFDASAIRRGHQVYTNVCSTCHSMNLMCYRNLVDVCYTEEEVREMAEDVEVVDGPNDEGEMFERPGKLSDPWPLAYLSEEEARFSNGGAYPPDLSLMAKARMDKENYIFSLLTGYREPPSGVTVADGMHYNPYFAGGQIAMPVQLMDGMLDYDDGTPATASQMAKDVSVFLAWAAEPKHDERKLMGLKWTASLMVAAALTGYYKRFRWGPLKSRRISYK